MSDTDIDVRVPSFDKSATTVAEISGPRSSPGEGKVVTWHKAVGDTVARDELLVEIETDKIVMEIVAPESGVLVAINASVGEAIKSEALVGRLRPHALKTTEAVEESSWESESDDTDAVSVKEEEPKARVNPFVEVTKLEKKMGNHLEQYWFLYLLIGMMFLFAANDIPYCFGLNCGQGR